MLEFTLTKNLGVRAEEAIGKITLKEEIVKEIIKHKPALNLNYCIAVSKNKKYIMFFSINVSSPEALIAFKKVPKKGKVVKLEYSYLDDHPARPNPKACNFLFGKMGAKQAIDRAEYYGLSNEEVKCIKKNYGL